MRYPVGLRLERAEVWLAWHSEDGPDRVVVDRRGFVLAWESETALRAATGATGEASSVEARVDRLLGGPVVCGRVLDVWNLLCDVCFSAGLIRLGERAPFERVGPARRVARLYDKLFFGCNLPALQGDGAPFVPTFSTPERRILGRVVRSGLEVLDRVLVNA